MHCDAALVGKADLANVLLAASCSHHMVTAPVSASAQSFELPQKYFPEKKHIAHDAFMSFGFTNMNFSLSAFKKNTNFLLDCTLRDFCTSSMSFSNACVEAHAACAKVFKSALQQCVCGDCKLLVLVPVLVQCVCGGWTPN